VNTQQLRVIVGGMLAGIPDHGGATWAVLQYVLGLRALGHDVVFVEEVERETLDDLRVQRYFANVADEFDLRGRAAVIAFGDDRTLGIDRSRLALYARTSDLVLNLSGNLRDPELLGAPALRVYVDLDPAFTQLWHEAYGIDMGFDGHDRFLTVGLAVGSDGCAVPTCGRTWTPTLPPVVLERWPVADDVVHNAFTTVANGRGYGSIRHGEVEYGQKLHSLRELISLPMKASEDFLLALAIDPGDDRDRRALHEHRWRLVDDCSFPRSPREYQRFVQGSKAEFGVAKSGYVRSRCAWFSDRSACYLASGRPVVAQDTGFSDLLPCGAGLLAFNDTEEAAAAVADVGRDYERHCRVARSLAAAYFDARIVLPSLLDNVAYAA
jgi:hypothetical protein